MPDRYDLSSMMNAAIKSAQSDKIPHRARGNLAGGIMLDAVTTVLEDGATVQITGFGPNHSPLSALTIVWDSSDDGVATVDSNGLVTAVADGTARITADGGGFVGFVDITVFDTTPATVDITPATVTLAALATQQLTAVVKNQFNNVIPGAVVTYVSDTPSKATVTSPGGLITAVATGSATITGTAAVGITDTCVVTVS